MSYGPVKVFSGSIASGASTLTSVDLSKSWSRIFVDVETMSTGAEITVYGSYDNSSFKPIYERIQTAPVSYQTLVISTNITGGIVQMDFPLQYMQFRTSAVVSGGVNIRVICVD